MRASRSILAALALSFNFVVAPAAAFEDPPKVAPVSGPWDAGEGFEFDGDEPEKLRQALSGIACPRNSSGKRLCLAVFDEGGEARYLEIKDGAYAVDTERVVLLPGDVEIDAEAAATDGAVYYVTGSHSAKRKNCKNNRDGRHVFRFTLDPVTGRALEVPAADPAGQFPDDKGALWTLMATVAGLSNHVGDNMCLGTEPPPDRPELVGKRGVNIEGLAVKDGKLFFGFRGPAADSTAPILSVDAEALFAGGDVQPVLSTIAVGSRRGVRDLASVSDGILILAGPDDDDKDAGWVVARWDAQESGASPIEPKPLAKLDLTAVALRSCDKELKPEAMAVVGDEPGKPYEIVIFSDGMCDGGPLAFTIPR